VIAAAERGPRPEGTASELILVVEDEERVRTLTAAALSELGYSVVAADSAATALQLLDIHEEVALLFTDIVMPEVNGRRLAELAAEKRPGLKVLFTTGFTRNAVVHNGILDAGVHFLPKPFTLEQLAVKVRSVIDGA
jgi:CheY-like chemotaxis protein